MDKTIEERVDDLENIYTDVPQLMNVRFDEVNGRLNLLDRQMAVLIRDLRDVRGGVTRQLIAQDAEIAALKEKLDEVSADLAALKDTLGVEVASLRGTLGAEVVTQGHIGRRGGLTQGRTGRRGGLTQGHIGRRRRGAQRHSGIRNRVAQRYVGAGSGPLAGLTF
jgi:hypothetical protein